MVFPISFQKDFLEMMWRITFVDKMPLVKEMTIEQFKILVMMVIPLNCNIQFGKLLEMFGKCFQIQWSYCRTLIKIETMKNGNFYSIIFNWDSFYATLDSHYRHGVNRKRWNAYKRPVQKESKKKKCLL